MRLSIVATGLVSGAVLLSISGDGTAHAQDTTSTQTSQSAQSKTVQVQPGDYLAKIANENQTTYPRLYDANANIKDPDIIYPGDTLRIPDPNEQLPSRPLPENTAAVASPPKVSLAPAKAKAVKKTAQPSPSKTVAAIPADGSVWDRLAACESGGNWAINTGNGYYGGLQFTLSTWRGVGGSGYPHQASREEQIARAQILQARSGWGQWPACTRKLGLR